MPYTRQDLMLKFKREFGDYAEGKTIILKELIECPYCDASFQEKIELPIKDNEKYTTWLEEQILNWENAVRHAFNSISPFTDE